MVFDELPPALLPELEPPPRERRTDWPEELFVWDWLDELPPCCEITLCCAARLNSPLELFEFEYMRSWELLPLLLLFDPPDCCCW